MNKHRPLLEIVTTEEENKLDAEALPKTLKNVTREDVAIFAPFSSLGELVLAAVTPLRGVLEVLWADIGGFSREFARLVEAFRQLADVPTERFIVSEVQHRDNPDAAREMSRTPPC